MTSTPPTAAPHDDSAVLKPAADGGSQTRRARRLSLLWWVLLPNGFVLVLAFLVLAVSPISISSSTETDELALLFVGLAVMVALNVVLLRKVLAPLFTLSEVMSSVDPESPGRRLVGIQPRSAEGRALADAFNSMLDRLEQARHDAARRALAAQEAERLRVAQELHDEIGQTLTAVMIEAERAALADPTQAAATLGRVAGAIYDSLEELRRIARELRPEALDDLGLINALIALCSRVDMQGNLRVRRDLQAGLAPLSGETELVIYRVAQEGLTNALRHAQATTATVTLTADAEAVTLSVRDDGQGMPHDLTSTTAGIAGMRERALLVGGSLEIQSRARPGDRVCLRVPVDGEGR